MLRTWFILNRERFELHQVPFTINKTNGGLVPIKIFESEVGFLIKNNGWQGKIVQIEMF